MFCIKVSVDVAGKLRTLTFADLPADLWPRGAAVDDLATAGEKMRKKA